MKKSANFKLKVFGSRASGTNRLNSDIDVLIEGNEKNIEQAKEALKYYSIEQGGPLDLFVLGSVDNEIDLIAAYSNPKNPRVVGVGSYDDFNDMFSSSFEINLQSLLAQCIEVDEIWGQTSSVEKTNNKLSKKF